MSKVTKYFRNRGAGYTDVYRIEFEWLEHVRYFVMYCHEHPDDPHGKSPEHHHLMGSGKLCQRAGRESRTMEHAEAFAHWWMERYSIYVRTGTFPMTSGTVRVPD